MEVSDGRAVNSRKVDGWLIGGSFEAVTRRKKSSFKVIAAFNWTFAYSLDNWSTIERNHSEGYYGRSCNEIDNDWFNVFKLAVLLYPLIMNGPSSSLCLRLGLSWVANVTVTGFCGFIFIANAPLHSSAATSALGMFIKHLDLHIVAFPVHGRRIHPKVLSELQRKYLSSHLPFQLISQCLQPFQNNILISFSVVWSKHLFPISFEPTWNNLNGLRVKSGGAL